MTTETKNPIRFLKGDATCPQAKGRKIIAHVCNDGGGWGKGFVVSLSSRWDEPEAAYREWHRRRHHNDFGPGAVQFVQVRPDIVVANMIAQHGVLTLRRRGSKEIPLRYDWLDAALAKVAATARLLRASVHMPRIGCGLAGGTWEFVEHFVLKQLTDKGIKVTVYAWAGG